jgi:uncharacterized repeat protein (TIGR01451 family)
VVFWWALGAATANAQAVDGRGASASSVSSGLVPGDAKRNIRPVETEPFAAPVQGITMSGTTLDLGWCDPGQQNLFNYAVHLNVNSAMPYSIEATAPASLDSVAPARSVPIDRLAWRVHQFGGAFTPFVPGAQTIVGGLAATPPGGRTTTLDYAFTPSFLDHGSKQDGSNPYQGTIVYTVTAGTIDSSFAAPNPFTPDGNADNDRTTIHWWQSNASVIDAAIYQTDGTTLVRKLTEGRTTGVGEQTIQWDGRDDDRLLVPEADYIYRISIAQNQAVNPGLSIASGTIGVQRGIGSGTSIVRGTVSSSGGAIITGATVALYREGGIRVATATTDSVGAYFFTGVGAGSFYLKASAPSYYEKQSVTFEVAAGTTVTMDLMLSHNHSLTIVKTASDTDAEPGDAIAYVVIVSTIGSVETVNDVTVVDDLPRGMRFVKGTMHRNGMPVVPLEMSDHHLVIPLGTMAPSEEVIITYNASVAVGSKPGLRRNSARALGYVRGVLVQTEPSSASVYVHDGDMGDRSLVFGRVYVDRDGDGKPSPGDGKTPLAKVVFDDGTIATTDTLGRYSVKGVRGGPRAIMAVLPNRTAAAGSLIASGPSKVKLVDLLDGVAAMVDFAFTVDEAARVGEGSGATFLGLFDARLGVDFSARGLSMVTLSGRGSFFVERDLGRGYRLTGSIDTRRDPRDEIGVYRDQVAYQPETGDMSRVSRGPMEKVGLTLRAPWGKAFVGRSYAMFDSSDLMNLQREVIGGDVTVTGDTWSWRAFAGVTRNEVRSDTFANDGTTGPFVLSRAPIALSSERVRVDTLDTDGDVTSSRGLATGVDYILDYGTGQLFLTKPVPALSATDQTVIVIEYEHVSNEEFPTAAIMGTRLEYKPIKTLRFGLSVLSEDSTRHTGGLVDAAYTTKRVDVSAAAAITDHSVRMKPVGVDDDPTAYRLRASVKPHPFVDLFGFMSRIGGAYDQPILSTTLPPTPISYGYLPNPTPTFMPIVESIFQGLETFPFVLQPRRDSYEVGVGTLVKDKTKQFRVSMGGTQLLADSGNKHTNYVTASWQSPKINLLPIFFAGTAATTLAGGETDRGWFVGARQPRGNLHYEVELLHHNTNGDAPVTGNAMLAKTSYGRYKWLMPGLLAQLSRDEQVGNCVAACEVTMLKRLAAGAESVVVKGARVFAYATFAELDHEVARTRDATQTGGFGGFLVSLKRIAGDLRVDGARDSRLGLVVSALGRLRVFINSWLTASSYLQYRKGTDLDARSSLFAVFGLAIRPPNDPRVVAFLKFKDKLVPSRYDMVNNQRNQLVTADVILPSLKPMVFGTRLAAKWSRTYSGDPLVTLLAAEEVTWHFKKRYDLVGGLRAVRTSAGGTVDFGSTVAAGVWFDDSYRFMIGLNYARRDWVFEADESIPGFFLNLTGIYGAAGAPSVMTW